MSTPPDLPPGPDETPDETWERLQRMYGETDAGPPPPEVHEPTELPAAPGSLGAGPEVGAAADVSAPIEPPPGVVPAGPPRQYHVSAPGHGDAVGPPPVGPPPVAPAGPGSTAVPPPIAAGTGAPRPPQGNATAARAAGAYAATASPGTTRARAGAGGPPAAPGGRQRKQGGVPGVPKPKLKWFRPKLRWFYLYLPLLVLLAIIATVGWAYWKVDHLYRVDLGDSLTPATGTALNYLIVGSDSRDGIDPESDDTGTIGDAKGQRSDTIIVLRIDGDVATMMSIPRDLWVKNPATGKNGRINATYNAGPANLVKAVTQDLGIPIQHYVEVDFVSFAGMVDAVGGVTIDFPHPASDRKSGLKVDTAGPTVLDGSQALAYVRSRTYTEIIDGKPRTDPTADLGRQQRQQIFIRTVLKEVGATRNPIALARVVGAASNGTRVDTELGLSDLWHLGRSLSGADPGTEILPTTPANKGGAAVLELKQPDATTVLRKFGAP